MTARSAPRRLAILAPLKEWGGIERKILILSNEFLAAGIEVDYLLTRGGRIPYPDSFPDAVNIIDLESKGKLDAVPKFMAYLRNRRPEAVLTVKDHAAKVAVLGRWLAGSDARVYVKATNTLSITLRRKTRRWTARRLYPRADRIIAISRGVRDDLIEKFAVDPAKIAVINNPMVTPDMAERARAPAPHPWLAEGEPPVFLGVGRLTRQKDFPTLVRAFAQLREHHRCRLIILGEGAEREGIEQLAADLNISGDVTLPGFVVDPIPWMARAKGFVLSSRYEGFGNVLVEAMAVGTPVASTDCPNGPAEILEQGRWGPLVPVGDHEALAKAMHSLLNDHLDAQALIASAERFRSDRIAAQYLSVMGLATPLDD